MGETSYLLIMELVKGSVKGYYYTTDRKYRISLVACATSSRVKATWTAVEHYATPQARTVVEATTLRTLSGCAWPSTSAQMCPASLGTRVRALSRIESGFAQLRPSNGHAL